MDGNLSRAEYYRKKADEIRIIAESLKDPETKKVPLSVAEDYLHMAAAIARMAINDSAPPPSNETPNCT
jgi:hypothetical protein